MTQLDSAACRSLRLAGARPRRHVGFTIVELLVVVAIISLLLAILAPALSKARQCAVITGELSLGRQLAIAHRAYATDAADIYMAGFPSTQMIQRGEVVVRDNAGQPLPHAGQPPVIAQRYPWRLLPYLDYTIVDWYRNKSEMDRLVGTENYAYAVSVAPRFGLNQTFVGGSADSDGTGYAFNPAYEQLARRAWGPWYARRPSDIPDASKLIVFASASDTDPSRRVAIDGFYRVTAPNFTQRRWRTTAPDAQTSSTQTGSVSFRFAGKTVGVMADGHAATMAFVEADDMRRWSPQATSIDWMLPNPQ